MTDVHIIHTVVFYLSGAVSKFGLYSVTIGMLVVQNVGNVSWRCPALQAEIEVSEGETIIHHTHEFAREVSGGPRTRKCLKNGARALARMGLRVIANDELRAKIKNDFLEEKIKEKKRKEKKRKT